MLLEVVHHGFHFDIMTHNLLNSLDAQNLVTFLVIDLYIGKDLG